MKTRYSTLVIIIIIFLVGYNYIGENKNVTTNRNSINYILDNRLKDRLIDSTIISLNSNNKSLSLTFKYLNRDKVEIKNEITQLIRELANSDSNITELNIYTKSSSVIDSYTSFHNVSLKTLMNLDDGTLLNRANDHWINLNQPS